MKKILYTTTAFILCGLAQSQAACIATPSCTTLGYTETSSCDGGLKCPFGSYWYCPSNSGSGGDSSGSGNTDDKTYNCKIGDIFYSDWSCSTDLVSGKTPIAVVVYMDGKGHGQALALNSIGKFTWEYRYDYHGNINNTLAPTPPYSSSDEAALDFSSCFNTAMMQQAGNSGEFPAAWSTYYYKTAGTQNGDWCLPAGGILTSYRKNKKTIDASFNKAGGEALNMYDFFWSSSQNNNRYAWGFKYQGSFLETSYKTYTNEVRPVLEF